MLRLGRVAVIRLGPARAPVKLTNDRTRTTVKARLHLVAKGGQLAEPGRIRWVIGHRPPPLLCARRLLGGGGGGGGEEAAAVCKEGETEEEGRDLWVGRRGCEVARVAVDRRVLQNPGNQRRSARCSERPREDGLGTQERGADEGKEEGVDDGREEVAGQAQGGEADRGHEVVEGDQAARDGQHPSGVGRPAGKGAEGRGEEARGEQEVGHGALGDQRPAQRVIEAHGARASGQGRVELSDSLRHLAKAGQPHHAPSSPTVG